MSQKHYLYEMKYNPEFIYEMGIQEVMRNEGDATPEEVVRSEDFKNLLLEEYQRHCAEHLERGGWFKKVDALEAYTDFWTWGRTEAYPA